MNVLSFLKDNGAELLQALSLLIAGASILANFTKTDKDNKALGAMSKGVHFLAANFFALKKDKA